MQDSANIDDAKGRITETAIGPDPPIPEIPGHDALLGALLDALTDHVYVKDTRGRYIFSNLAHARFLGVPSTSDVLGKTASDFFPAELARKYDAEDRGVIETGCEIVDEYGKSVVVGGQSKVVVRTKRPLRDRQGRIIGLVGIARDVTEQVHAQESLGVMQGTLEKQVAVLTAAAEQRARELSFQKFALDQSAIVGITDARGRITDVNDKFCQISGYTREELIGQDHRIVNSGLHPKEFFKQMYATITRGHVWCGEIRNRAKDGSLYWVDATIVPIKDEPDGHIKGYFSIRVVITALKQMQERLQAAKETAEAAQRAEGEFLANMSHEIRTPMTAIIGYADLLAEPDRPLAERREFVQTIRRNGEHLLSLINDLLDLSRVEAGKLTIETIACNPRQIAGEIESCLSGRAKAKGIDLGVECESRIPQVVFSDPTRLRQVLLNLVSNAIKFTQTGSVRIRIAYDSTRKTVKFAVADTGIGLSLDQQQAIFRPFAQADNSTMRKFGGTGLGLALSKRLVEMLGGQLTLTSECGKGSVFSFTLRDRAGDTGRAAKPVSATQGPQENSSAHRQVKPLRGRLLLVEDGADNRRLVTIYLERAGLSVECAENGGLALDMVSSAHRRGAPYDLILMDMQMPVMDGYQATAELRRRGFREVPIIAFTAHALPGERDKCLAAGCNDYSTKPVNPEALVRTIAKQLKGAGVAVPRRKARALASRTKFAATAPAGASPKAACFPSGPLRSLYADHEAVQRVLPSYIEDLPKHVAEMSAYLAARRLEELRRIVHQMKGSGGGYGFPDITRAAASAETSIKAHVEIEKIEMSVKELCTLIRSVEGYEPAKELASAGQADF